MGRVAFLHWFAFVSMSLHSAALIALICIGLHRAAQLSAFSISLLYMSLHQSFVMAASN